MSTALQDNTTAIRSLNDQLRKTLIGGRIVMTSGVTAQGEEAVKQLLGLLTSYNDFSPDNDPYGEHDFGSIKHNQKTYFWKIDTYDKTLSMHSPDAANPHVTVRVLTLMLAEEY